MEQSRKIVYKLDELLKSRKYPKLRLAKNAKLQNRS